MKIGAEPKSAVVKQYQKLLKLDDVDLEFEKEALEAIVDKAIERKTGARGLRSIIEEIMRDIMFDIPSHPDIEKCIITKNTVEKGESPKLVINPHKKTTAKTGAKPERKNTNQKEETA